VDGAQRRERRGGGHRHSGRLELLLERPVEQEGQRASTMPFSPKAWMNWRLRPVITI